MDGRRARGNKNEQIRRWRQFGYCQGWLVVVLRQKERAATRPDSGSVRPPQQQKSLSRQNSHKRISGWPSSYHRHTAVHTLRVCSKTQLYVYSLRARDDFQLHVTSFPAPLVLSWQGQCCEAYQKYSCMSNIIRVSYLCQYLSVLFVSNTRDSNANESMSVHFIFANQLYGWIAHTNIKRCQRQSGRGCSFYCLTVETDVPGV